MKKNIGFISLIVLTLLLTACGQTKQIEQSADAEIQIGVAYPAESFDKDTYFYEGIELAVNSINEAGGVLGKPIKMVVKDDKGNTHTALQQAEGFSEQGLSMVIGHWSTNVCYYTEDTYEENEMVMLTPAATGMNIFENQYNYIFRMIANNQDYAQAIAQSVNEKGLKRIVIYYSDDEFGNDFATVIENELAEFQIEVIDRVTSVTRTTLKDTIDRWNAFGCDGMVVAAVPPSIIEPLKLVLGEKRDLPIFGASNFDRISFLEEMEEYSDTIYVVSYSDESLDAQFLQDYEDAYGHKPDTYSVVAYECVYLLKSAMEATGATDAASIAEYLGQINELELFAGKYTYSPETQEFEGHNLVVDNIRRH